MGTARNTLRPEIARYYIHYPDGKRTRRGWGLCICVPGYSSFVSRAIPPASLFSSCSTLDFFWGLPSITLCKYPPREPVTHILQPFCSHPSYAAKWKFEICASSGPDLAAGAALAATAATEFIVSPPRSLNNFVKQSQFHKLIADICSPKVSRGL